VIHGTRAAAAVMVAQRAGHIVNMGSLAALAPVPGISLYSASKFAVRGFSLAAAEELRPHGVFVTVVCPDAVRTPMLDLQVGYKEAALTFSGPRALTVEEIGDVILRDVLVRRPREAIVPRTRGWLAKLASLAPDLAAVLRPGLEKKGLAAQEAEKKRRAGE
jgi:3-oxoacyl-[acyl-carrier protein] reductase